MLDNTFLLWMSMMKKESIVWGAFSIVLVNPVAQQKQPLILSLEG